MEYIDKSYQCNLIRPIKTLRNACGKVRKGPYITLSGTVINVQGVEIPNLDVAADDF